MELTPKQQTSEAVRQAETIVVLTGQHPSIDQVSAVIALTMILRKFGKKVSAVISDTLPPAAQLLDTANVERNLGGLRDFILKLDLSKAEADKLRYEIVDGKLEIFVTPFKGGFAPSDVTFDYGNASFEYDLAIVLGVPTRARIDKVYEQNQALFAQIPLVNLDFHRSNENYGAVNLVETTASSLCEMLVALSESLQGGIIDADIATALLMGIVGSTDRFTAAHTTSKSLTVAAQMMAAGAKQQAVVRALYREGGRNDGGRAEGGRNDGGRGEGGRGERSNNDRSQNERNGERGHGRDKAPRDNGPRDNGSREAARVQAPAARLETPASPAEAPVAAAPAVAPATVAPVVSAPAAAAQVVAETPVAAAKPAPVAPAAPVSAPEAPDTRPFTPIIDPGHIELSRAPELPAAAVVTPAAQPANLTAAAQVLVQPPVQAMPGGVDRVA